LLREKLKFIARNGAALFSHTLWEHWFAGTAQEEKNDYAKEINNAFSGFYINILPEG
jgi:hypothetical protein